ncbi:hypothetical protein QQ045_015740 [Rhodiola kirilowii]
MNALVDVYGKCGEVGNAHQLFDKMHVTDVVPCNASFCEVWEGYGKCDKEFQTPSTAQTNVDLEVKVPDEKDWNSSKVEWKFCADIGRKVRRMQVMTRVCLQIKREAFTTCLLMDERELKRQKRKQSNKGPWSLESA